MGVFFCLRAALPCPRPKWQTGGRGTLLPVVKPARGAQILDYGGLLKGVRNVFPKMKIQISEII